MSVAHILRVALHWSGLGEEGTIGFYMSGNAASHTDEQLHDAIGNALSLLNTNESPSTMSNLAKLICPDQSFDELALYEYDTLPGHATGIGKVAPNVAGSVGVTHPLQVSAVATLKSAMAGPSYTGKMYLPAHTMTSVNTSARFTQTQTDQLATTAAAFIGDCRQGIQTSLDIDQLGPVVYSVKKGIVTPLLTLDVDNRPDIQRRRANKLQPTATSTIQDISSRG